MRNVRIFLITLVICLIASFAAAEPVDEAAMAMELWQAQSLPNMQVGVYAIPEKALNTYFSAIARDNPKVRDAAITVLGNDKMQILLDAEGPGTLRFTCAIRELHYDRDRASLELYIEKKEVVGRPFVSWVVDHMSLGLLTGIYGNPLDGTSVSGKFKGNTVYIDLKPFTASLFKNTAAQKVGDVLVISKATADTGVVYLHTNFVIGAPLRG